MGFIVFLYVTAAILPALICLGLFFLSEELFHCRFCTWSYFWMGAGLGLWQLWRASPPEPEVGYGLGIAILAVTNFTFVVYIVVQRRPLRRELAAGGDTSET
jgi:hypothetical protein